MTQEAPSPPIPIDPCVAPVVRALSSAPGLTEPQRIAVGQQAMRSILSLLPQDSLQMMIAGQVVLFSALAAEAYGTLPEFTDGATRRRAESGLMGMGRLVAKHLDTLIKLQGRAGTKTRNKDHIPDIPAPAPEAVVTAPAEPEGMPPTDVPAVASATVGRTFPGREKMLRACGTRLSPRQREMMARKGTDQPLRASIGHGSPGSGSSEQPSMSYSSNTLSATP